MATYKCSICGCLFQEETEGRPFSELTECPICGQSVSNFKLVEETNAKTEQNLNTAAKTETESEIKEDSEAASKLEELNLSYPKEWERKDSSCRYMQEIHDMAVSGHSIHGAMGTQIPMPGWDDILILGAQLNPMPLEANAPVSTTVVIGKHAKRPMILENPVYISHMSFGALSREIKIALSKGSAMAKAAMC
ncbi:MAG: glutamate synthase-related protein, partial [Lachnospiraceae bacterium]